MNDIVDVLKEIFEKSNLCFLKNDKSLLIHNVSERSWYSRFAIYMTELIKKYGIKNYYVDTEYNRNGNRLKTVFDTNLEIINITCDVILHSRGTVFENDNLICIEMKKSNALFTDKEEDKKRLKLLTKNSYDGIWSADGQTLPEHVCGYKLGIYYEINIESKSIYIEYYENGELKTYKNMENVF